MDRIRVQFLQRLQRVMMMRGGFESQRLLSKWLVLSTLIGIIAGFGSVLLYLGINWSTRLFLGRIVGYMPPGPVGEGTPTLLEIARPWLLPIVTAAGGLVSGLMVLKLAPEAEGDDAVIEAIHRKRGRIRGIVPAVKAIASAITIGTGGSAGREGPAAAMVAGITSVLGQRLGLDAQTRRIAVAAGIGAGIGAIFRAPLGGALISAEILYVHDLEIEALVPGLIASIVGYTIFGGIFGYEPTFGAQPQIGFDQPIQLFYYALLGIACGLTGILYARSLYGMTDFFKQRRIPAWVKPMLGGLTVGLIGMALPSTLHMGYGWVQIAMEPNLHLLPLWLILVLPFAKILSTSLSLGSGAAGGIFGPGMVIGGMLGASFWHLFHAVFPGMPADPVPFIIIGMMGVFGGIAHAPLAVMLMVAEMTGNLSLLAPAMVVVAISTAVVGDNTIYRSQLRDRASSPAHRLRFSFPLLSSLCVRDAMTPCKAVMGPSEPAGTAAALMEQLSVPGLVLLNEDGSFAGLVTRQQIDRLPPESKSAMKLGAAAHQDPVVLSPDDPLDVALERIALRGLSWAPVFEQGLLAGKLTIKDSISTYRSTLEKSIHRTTALPGNTVLIEARLDGASGLAGKTLKQAGFPRDTLLVSIARLGDTLFPQADTRLEAGDLITIMADPESENSLREFLTHGTSRARRESNP